VSQNRPAADRAGVIAGLLREGGDGALAAEVGSPGGKA
jgi:predicted FMN-binding regulatory protein PaiB